VFLVIARRRTTVRLALSLGSAILPWAIRRRVLRSVLGWDLAGNARIGVAAISAEQVTLAPGAKIGHFTVCRHLDKLTLGQNALIGKGNWITATPRGGPSFGEDRSPELTLERDAAITGQHLIDCTDRVHIGQFATLAGWRSQILTHALDVRSNRQTCRPVVIGEYSFIGTGVVLLPGCEVPARSIVAAGSVVTSALEEEFVTYAGAPAKRVKSLTGDELYFSRSVGRVL
jgi:acetyltransferase-like isoleucine patch superfamily enzyme